MQLYDNHLPSKLLRAYRERDGDALAPSSEKVFAAGTPLIHQDEVPEDVFIVLHGTVRVHIDTPKGTEYLVALEGPGELIGEVEALTGEPATCSVTALTECTLAVIPRKSYEQWLTHDHDFGLVVNRIICRRLQLFTKRAATHLTYPMEYSVLKFLKVLSDEAQSPRVDVSKEELANYLGTSIRSINRILKDLQTRDILSTTQGLEIISMERLENAMRAYDE